MWAQKRLRVGGVAAIDADEAEKNATSIDGLPAVDVPRPATPPRLRAEP